MAIEPIRQYSESERLLKRAMAAIPLGAQTFSKSVTQYPLGVSPFFIDRARGALTWDVDGNEYVDFNNALCSVTLGHCDPDITAAVTEQLERGTIFSLSNALEIDVAEKIIAAVPCAQKVRFGKNGSDATAGAIRAARAFTGRERIAVCGYHGWQDWYIGSTARSKGVPHGTRALTSGFAYNDISSLNAVLADGEPFAAIILEPMNTTWPAPGFLQQVVDAAHAHGALAIFDETITGFRYAIGGAQEYFGVTPDLACFGKGLANGYPLSAVAGRADVMAEFEEVFFSFTMGGETLSLAAANVAIAKTRDAALPDHLTRLGTRLLDGVDELIGRHDCYFLNSAGHPSWTFLLFGEAAGATSFELKTLYMQEVLDRGILTFGTHNLSLAHDDGHIDRLLTVYDEVFPLLARAARDGDVRDHLRCEPLQPLFKVR